MGTIEQKVETKDNLTVQERSKNLASLSRLKDNILYSVRSSHLPEAYFSWKTSPRYYWKGLFNYRLNV